MKNCIGVFAVILVLIMPIAAVCEVDSEEQYPLSVKDAVEVALKNNLNISLQKDTSIVAEGAIQIAEGRFDEQIKVSTGYESVENPLIAVGTAEDEERGKLEASLSKRFVTGTEVELGWDSKRYDTDADGMLINPSYGSEVSIEVTQPLLRGFGIDVQTGEVLAAEKSYEASVFEVDSLSADLAAQVKKSYWDLVYAWQDIEVRQLSVELAKNFLAETLDKIEAGRLAEVEMYQPQSEVARREEELISAERAIGFAEDELKLLMNSDDWFLGINPIDKPITTAVNVDPQLVLKNALENRPDLLAAERNIEAAKIQEMLAEDDLKPILNLVGGLGYGGTDDNYGDALGDITDDTDTRWNVGLMLTFPFDNSAAKGSLRQAHANYSKAKTSAELLRVRIKKSIRTTVRDIKLAQKAMDATRKTSIATQKRLEAEQTKFDAGRSTTLDVLAAQEAYSRALSQENKTSITYVQLLAELDRIQGIVTLEN